MAATEDPIISTNEKDFILRGLREHCRPDGRLLLEHRKITFSFDRSEGKATAEITIGDTRVISIVSAAVAVPFPDRPNEGFLSFNVNTSPMTGSTYDAFRQSALTSELAKMLERQIRDSRALDTEALCIAPGEKVWALRCDVHIVDDAGNLIDACALATIAAILHFRRADVSVINGKTVVHSYTERAPVPLAIHHIPICITYGLFRNLLDPLRGEDDASRKRPRAAMREEDIGSRPDDFIAVDREIIVIDPTDRETLVHDGSISFVMNAHRELCGVHKLGGCALPAKAIMLCAKVAGLRASQIIQQLKTALATAETEDVERQRARHAVADLGLSEAAGPTVSTRGDAEDGKGQAVAEGTAAALSDDS